MSAGKDEDLAVAAAQVSKEVAQQVSHHCATAEAAKQFRTLQARAALCGCELHALAGGGYLLSRWCLTYELHDTLAVEALLVQMGGAA